MDAVTLVNGIGFAPLAAIVPEIGASASTRRLLISVSKPFWIAERKGKGRRGVSFGLSADWMCAACVYIDELALAEQLTKRSHQAAYDAGDVARRCQSSYYLAMVILHQGRLDEAVARLEAGLRRHDTVWTSELPWPASALCVAPSSSAAGPGTRPLRFISPTTPIRTASRWAACSRRAGTAIVAGDPATALGHYEASGQHLAFFSSMRRP